MINYNIWKQKDSQPSNLASSSAVSAGITNLTPDGGTSAIHCPVQKLSLGFTGCKVSHISHRAGWQHHLIHLKEQRKERPFFWRQLISIDHWDFMQRCKVREGEEQSIGWDSPSLSQKGQKWVEFPTPFLFRPTGVCCQTEGFCFTLPGQQGKQQERICQSPAAPSPAVFGL